MSKDVTRHASERGCENNLEKGKRLWNRKDEEKEGAKGKTGTLDFIDCCGS